MSVRLFQAIAKPSGTSTDFSNANIVCFGNSLTYGQESSNPATKSYPAVLKTLAPFNVAGCTITNVGVSGRTTQELIATQSTVVNPLYVAGKRNIVLVFEMINDIFNNCLDAATAYAHIVTLCGNLKAAGWEVWVGGTTVRNVSVAPSNSCGSAAAIEAISNAANALVAANALTIADGYLNLRRNTNLTDPDLYTAYLADSIHYNDAGYYLLAVGIAQDLTNAA